MCLSYFFSRHRLGDWGSNVGDDKVIKYSKTFIALAQNTLLGHSRDWHSFRAQQSIPDDPVRLLSCKMQQIKTTIFAADWNIIYINTISCRIIRQMPSFTIFKCQWHRRPKAYWILCRLNRLRNFSWFDEASLIRPRAHHFHFLEFGE